MQSWMADKRAVVTPKARSPMVQSRVASQSVVEWSRTIVAEEIPTQQSIASDWQNTGTLRFGGYKRGVRPVGTRLDAFRMTDK